MTLFAVTATICLATASHGTLCRDIALLKHPTLSECLRAEEHDTAAWMTVVRQVFGPDYVLRKHACAEYVPPPADSD